MVSATAPAASNDTPPQLQSASPQKLDTEQHGSSAPSSPSKSKSSTPAKADPHSTEATEAVDLYPPPPGASPQDSSLPPPPAYEDVKQSELERLTGSTGSSFRTAAHAAGQRQPQSDLTEGNSPTAGRRLEIIDRSAGEALQIQVGARSC